VRRLLAVAALLLAADPAAPLPAIGERAFVDEAGSVELSPDVIDAILGLVRVREPGTESIVRRVETRELAIPEDSESVTIRITFVADGANYRNALGYFVYEEAHDETIRILERQLVFPNASLTGSGGSLQVGDSSLLRDAAGETRVFEPRERIGFFLVADGWQSAAIQRWDAKLATVPSEDPAGNSRPGHGVYTTLPRLNPELAEGRDDRTEHVRLLELIDDTADPARAPFGREALLVIAFEDMRRSRSTDDDFDDAVFIVSVEAGAGPE
jgi:hypothetical protein